MRTVNSVPLSCTFAALFELRLPREGLQVGKYEGPIDKKGHRSFPICMRPSRIERLVSETSTPTSKGSRGRKSCDSIFETFWLG